MLLGGKNSSRKEKLFVEAKFGAPNRMLEAKALFWSNVSEKQDGTLDVNVKVETANNDRMSGGRETFFHQSTGYLGQPVWSLNGICVTVRPDSPVFASNETSVSKETP